MICIARAYVARQAFYWRRRSKALARLLAWTAQPGFWLGIVSIFYMKVFRAFTLLSESWSATGGGRVRSQDYEPRTNTEVEY